MKTNILQRFLSWFKPSEPGPKVIAQQLRKPTGEYAKRVGDNMDKVNEALYNLTLDAMEPQVGDRILEIGFGTGKFFEKMITREREVRVSGIDYSEEMVEIAKNNNLNSITSGKLNLQLGNSDAIPFPDASFDKVYCNMVIYFWDKPENHLKEIHRVLKPRGKFYTGIRSRKSMAPFPFVKFGFTLYKGVEWKNILKQNGFFPLETQKQLDPPIEFNGDQLQLESYCIVAMKDS